MKAIITVGVSGSGKSTWASDMADHYSTRNTMTMKEYTVINRDTTRWEISGKKGWNGPNAYKFDKHIEGHVTARNNDKIVLASLKGQDIIISDTNLNPTYRNRLIEMCKFLGYEDIEIKEFPISYQEALRRDATRGIFSVGENVLSKQWEMWVKYHMDKGDGMWHSPQVEDE